MATPTVLTVRMKTEQCVQGQIFDKILIGAILTKQLLSDGSAGKEVSDVRVAMFVLISLMFHCVQVQYSSGK